ncbi:MAG: hypothetical protein KA138_12780, partial [Saprospiraceae bacterium]|nr:hypothetical protein [Saprospiraceae bacterium]
LKAWIPNANVESFAQEAERLLWAFNRFGWTPNVVDWVLQNPGHLGIANAKQWDLAWWQSLAAFHRLLPAGEEASDAFRNMLETNQVNWTSVAALWKEEVMLVKSVADALNITYGKPLHLLDIQKGLAWCKRLGLDGSQVKQLTDDSSFQTIENARDLVIGAFARKYPAQSDREKQLRPHENQSEALKRDALVAWLLNRPEYGFNETNDLYAYFLLDPEMDGCSQTSKIQAAHSTVQLYIHRVLMNLEQGGNDFSVLDNIPIDTLDEFKQEWEWRKNYRVWEANRKVFLYPETYIEPDLRDNKTPIFRELEEELLQQELSQETAEAAFRNYFAKFDELAQLYIAGSFYHAETNTYYFFGRTRSTPYQYYFRKWENQSVWTAWEKMELAIDTGAVTGIVLNGKLWVFWASVENDKTIFLSFSTRGVNKRWTTPNQIEFYHYNGEKLKADVDYDYPLQIFPATEEDESGIISLNIYLLNVGKIWRNFKLTDFSLSEYSTDESPENFENKISKGDRFLHAKKNRSSIRSLFSNSKLRSEVFVDIGSISDIDFNDDITSIPIISGLWISNPVGGRPIESILSNSLFDSRYQYLAKNIAPFIPIAGQFNSTSLERYPISARTINRQHHLLIRLNSFPEKNLYSLMLKSDILSFLTIHTQSIPERDFSASIKEPTLAIPPKPVNHLDFTGPYGDYYHELFFHVPFLIAHQFNANQQFKEAKWWYERIFDPTATGKADDPDRPWRYIEFRGLGIQKIKEALANEAALERYRRDPFNPHAIARLRITAYQKAIVMKYIDNLLDWGDDLFNRYTRESLNEAAMLYMLASDILGPRPAVFGECKVAEEAQLTYGNLAQKEEALGDFLIRLENWSIENAPENPEGEPVLTSNVNNDPAAALGDTLAFCIPQNENLREYWDRVADRMYKIRRCLDINGQRRMLPLYQPPIDPMLLVRAKAMGLSLDKALGEINKEAHYRFVFLIERARQYAQTVQSFGSALLSALNSKDAEELMLLRSVQEREILRMGREMRKKGIEESKFNLRAIEESKANVNNRFNYFSHLVTNGLIPAEKSQKELRNKSAFFHSYASELNFVASIVAAFLKPDEALNHLADAFDSVGKYFGILSDLSASSASFFRRDQDWVFQRDTAAQELKQLAQQLLAAEIRVSIAEKDLEMHERNIEHAQELDDFYRDKFTNRGLFEYMSRTLHTLHRQAYAMAYDTALMAQNAFEHERGENPLMIQPIWQADRAGLLAGEQLLLQIQRLERRYEELNTRDLELTKHISLQQLNPF